MLRVYVGRGCNRHHLSAETPTPLNLALERYAFEWRKIISNYLCPHIPYTPTPTGSDSTTTVSNAPDACGPVTFNQTSGDLTVCGDIQCSDGEAVMAAGMKASPEQESRVVAITFQRGTWNCGASGANSPLTCKDQSNPATYVEWMLHS